MEYRDLKKSSMIMFEKGEDTLSALVATPLYFVNILPPS
jgi:hypothetical protein